MGYLECPGCGEGSFTASGLKQHLKKCSKFLLLPSKGYIPTVHIEDIPYLLTRQVPDSNVWGIYNDAESDWVRDKAGNIEIRTLEDNIREFKRWVVAESALHLRY